MNVKRNRQRDDELVSLCQFGAAFQLSISQLCVVQFSNNSGPELRDTTGRSADAVSFMALLSNTHTHTKNKRRGQTGQQTEILICASIQGNGTVLNCVGHIQYMLLYEIHVGYNDEHKALSRTHIHTHTHPPPHTMQKKEGKLNEMNKIK